MKRTTDHFKLDFRFSRLQTKIEKRTSSSIFVFQNGKRKSKNEFGVEIRFSICETQKENRIMKRTTDLKIADSEIAVHKIAVRKKGPIYWKSIRLSERVYDGGK